VRSDKEESSFLKKRSKRLSFLRSFPLGGHGRDIAACAGLKVFWFFSSEKNNFASLNQADDKITCP
jgi:hypothetical protein